AATAPARLPFDRGDRPGDTRSIPHRPRSGRLPDREGRRGRIRHLRLPARFAKRAEQTRRTPSVRGEDIGDGATSAEDDVLTRDSARHIRRRSFPETPGTPPETSGVDDAFPVPECISEPMERLTCSPRMLHTLPARRTSARVAL